MAWLHRALIAISLLARATDGALKRPSHLQSDLLVNSDGEASQRGIRFLQRREVSSNGVVQPHEAGWFDGFSAGESTFDDNGDSPHDGPTRTHFFEGFDKRPDVVSGTEPHSPQFFHESPSAAGVAAWSSHFPPSGNPPPWRLSQGNRWIEDYVISPDGGLHGRRSQGKMPPAWFDNSIAQRDNWERERQPNPPLRWRQNSARWYTTWQERSVNTTLACADPNCSSSVALWAYDPLTEMAANCRLSFPVHPTDYDDLYSGERVETIYVNGHLVQSDCFPSQNSCSDIVVPMFYCVLEYPVDALFNDGSGVLVIEAKISDVVDECPYEGNMLSAVPIVTCMVRPIEPPPPPPPPVDLDCREQVWTTMLPLQCPTRGCVASGILRMDPTLFFESCSLNVDINQTDFDGEQGSVEIVEWVNVSAASIASRLAPGQNPCDCNCEPGEDPRSSFPLVQGHNVTAEARTGEVPVSLKISDLVDECASQGYLLDAMATLTCVASC